MGVQQSWQNILSAIFEPAVYAKSMANFIDAKQLRQERIAAMVAALVATGGFESEDDYLQFMREVSEQYPNYNPYVMMDDSHAKLFSDIVFSAYTLWIEHGEYMYDKDWTQFVMKCNILDICPLIQVAAHQGTITKQSHVISSSFHSLAIAAANNSTAVSLSDLQTMITARCSEMPVDAFDDLGAITNMLSDQATDIKSKVTQLTSLIKSSIPTGIHDDDQGTGFIIEPADLSDMNGYKGISQLIEECDDIGDKVKIAAEEVWNSVSSFCTDWLFPKISDGINKVSEAMEIRGFSHDTNANFPGLNYAMINSVIHPLNDPSYVKTSCMGVDIHEGDSAADYSVYFADYHNVVPLPFLYPQGHGFNSPMEMLASVIKKLPYDRAIRFPMIFGDIIVYRDKGDDVFENFSPMKTCFSLVGFKAHSLTINSFPTSCELVAPHPETVDDSIQLKVTNSFTTPSAVTVSTPISSYLMTAGEEQPDSTNRTFSRFKLLSYKHKESLSANYRRIDFTVTGNHLLEACTPVITLRRNDGSHWGHLLLTVKHLFGDSSPHKYSIIFAPYDDGEYTVYIDGTLSYSDKLSTFSSSQLFDHLISYGPDSSPDTSVIMHLGFNVNPGYSEANIPSGAFLTLSNFAVSIGDADDIYTVTETDDEALKAFPGWGQMYYHGEMVNIPNVHYAIRLSPVGFRPSLSNISAQGTVYPLQTVDSCGRISLDAYALKLLTYCSSYQDSPDRKYEFEDDLVFTYDGSDPQFDPSETYSHENNNQFYYAQSVFNGESIVPIEFTDDKSLCRGFFTAESLLKIFLSAIIKKAAFVPTSSPSSLESSHSEAYDVLTSEEMLTMNRIFGYFAVGGRMFLDSSGYVERQVADGSTGPILNDKLVDFLNLDPSSSYYDNSPRHVDKRFLLDYAILSLLGEWWRNTTDGIISNVGSEYHVDYSFLPYQEITTTPTGAINIMSDSANRTKALVQAAAIVAVALGVLVVGATVGKVFVNKCIKNKQHLLAGQIRDRENVAAQTKSALDDLRKQIKDEGRRPTKEESKLLKEWGKEVKAIAKQSTKAEKFSALLTKVRNIMGLGGAGAAGVAASLPTTVADIADAANSQAADESDEELHGVLTEEDINRLNDDLAVDIELDDEDLRSIGSSVDVYDAASQALSESGLIENSVQSNTNDQELIKGIADVGLSIAGLGTSIIDHVNKAVVKGSDGPAGDTF